MKSQTTSRRAFFEHTARRLNTKACNRMRDPAYVWYVGFTRSGHELATARAVHQWGGTVHLPLLRKWRRVNRYARVKRKISYPALPGCVLLGFLWGQERWFDLFRCIPSLNSVLGLRGAPIAVSGCVLLEFIENNRFKFEPEACERHMRSNCEFKIGDRARIVEGPFEGRIVDVKTIQGPNAHTLFDLFGGVQHLVVPLDQLEKAA